MTTTVHISSVYPVARAFSFGEPTSERSFVGISGSEYGTSSFVKDGLKVDFHTTDGIVTEVSVSLIGAEVFLATAEDDAAQIGLRALAGVEVLH